MTHLRRDQISRQVSLLLSVLLVIGILAVGEQPAKADSLSLTVPTWDVNTSTGVVTYNATLSDVCDTSSCGWKIEAYYASAGVEKYQGTLGSGTVNASSSNPVSFSKPVSGSSTLNETTHVRATVTPSSGTTRTTTVAVSAPYPDGSISLTVNKWDLDTDTGVVDYDVTMKVVGAKQENGPCGVRCYYSVEAWYKDGTTERLQHALYSGDCLSGCWTVTKPITSSASGAQISREVTHLKAYVHASSSSCPAPCSREVYETWVSVSPPYPSGSISLDVTEWNKDPSTGKINYDVTMKIVGAKQENGPCGVRCYRFVEAWYKDGTSEDLQHTLHSYDCLSGCWTVTKQLLSSAGGAVQVTKPVTHIRAYVRAGSSACPDPCSREVYDTGLIPVSDFMLDDIDVAFVAGVLETTNVTVDELCITVEERARMLRIPDATPSTPTIHSATEACLSASTVRAALKAIAVVVGGAAVIGAIIHHYADGPNADSITKVPPPETDVAGSGVRPPTSCLSDVQKAEIEAELAAGNWVQDHHAASNKNSYWTQVFKDLLARPENAYATEKSLNGDWNIVEDLLHRGTHPPAYHFWIYRNLEKGLWESSTWDEFLQKWNDWVMNVIRDDPTIIRWEWWRCP